MHMKPLPERQVTRHKIGIDQEADGWLLAGSLTQPRPESKSCSLDGGCGEMYRGGNDGLISLVR